MKQENNTHTEKGTSRRFGTYIILLSVGFLVGFIPMWWKVHQCSGSLSDATKEIHLAKLKIAVSTAVIDARRGEYEPARLAISDFFTSLRIEINKEDASSLTASQRKRGALLFSKRDEIVTLLARSDAASSEQLSELYLSYCDVVPKK